MDNSAKIDKFFSEERKFLNKHVDLTKILKLEGWRPMQSRFQGEAKFQHKGRIVTVIFHKGQDAWHWTDDLNKAGSSLDLLKNDGEADTKKRFFDALEKLKKYAVILKPKETAEFYSKYQDVLDMLKPFGQHRPAVDPYLRYERHFLQTEVSIYKLAHEIGYRPREGDFFGKKWTHFVRGDITLSLKKRDNIYLWYDSKKKRGGTNLDFFTFSEGIPAADAYEKLKEAALRLVLPEKLQEFLIKAYEIKPQRLSDGSLRSMIERTPVSTDFRLQSIVPHLPHIRDLQEAYRRVPALKVWDSDVAVIEVLPRHFRIPELNPSFQRVTNEVGLEDAQELTRIALLRVAAKNIPAGRLQTVLGSEILKPGVRVILNTVKDISEDLASGIDVDGVKRIMEYFKTEASRNILSTGSPDIEKTQGLSM